MDERQQKILKLEKDLERAQIELADKAEKINKQNKEIEDTQEELRDARQKLTEERESKKVISISVYDL